MQPRNATRLRRNNRGEPRPSSSSRPSDAFNRSSKEWLSTCKTRDWPRDSRFRAESSRTFQLRAFCPRDAMAAPTRHAAPRAPACTGNVPRDHLHAPRALTAPILDGRQEEVEGNTVTGNTPRSLLRIPRDAPFILRFTRFRPVFLDAGKYAIRSVHF